MFNLFSLCSCGSFLRMSPKDIIGSYKVLNLGGTRASKGFSYQNHWSIKKLIDLHMSGKDYVMLFEVYDDVSVLDSESDPKKISIYQIKSNQNQIPVRLSHLCTKEKDKNSILAKLLLTKKNLPKELGDMVDSLHIVSNSSYQHNSKFHSSITTPVSIVDHYHDGLKKKVNSLSKETGISDAEVQVLLEITFLIKSPLSYDEPDRQIRDLLQEFFKNYFDNFDFDITPFYQQLLNEVVTKCNAEKIVGYEETLKSKSLTKKWFDSVLRGISPDTKRQLKKIIVDLQKDCWTADMVTLLEREWIKMEIDNLNDKEYHNGKMIKVIEELILKFETAKYKYSEMADIVLIELKNNHISVCGDKTDYYIKSLILWRTLNYRIKALES